MHPVIVDIHAHYYPRAYFACLSRMIGAEVQPLSGFPAATLDERADQVKEAGIDLQILSLGNTVQHLARIAEPGTAARVANDALADAAANSRGRFGAFGAPPLPDVDAALQETERCLDSLNMLGLSIGCTIGDRSPEDELFHPFWEELNRRGTLVLLHPVQRHVDPLLEEYDLNVLIGAPYEDALAALRIVQSGLTARFPKVKFVVPHLGGGISASYGRMRSRVPLAKLQELYYDTATCIAPALRCACALIGTDRLMFGTDIPMVLVFGLKSTGCRPRVWSR